jgi:hypothetical protein
MSANIEKKIEKLVCIVDDEIDLANDLRSDLNIPEDTDCKIAANINDVKEILDKNIYGIIFFIVDLQLKANREGGIDVIKLIKLYDSSILSFITVYSAHPNLKLKSLNSGGDLFFHRNPVRESNETNCLEINNVISKFLSYINSDYIEMQLCLSDTWEERKEIPSQVIDYNEEFVTLNCMIDPDTQDIVKKVFPRNLFKDFKDIYIDKSILLVIKDRPKRICYCFNDKNVAEVDEIFKENNSEFKIDDLDAFNSKEE